MSSKFQEDRSTMSRPTACIISRVMTIDLPWYAQWLEHHVRLGFSHFRLFYCDDVHLPLKELLSFYPEDQVTLTLLPKASAENDLIHEHCGEIDTDYTLYIDSDEFLILPEGLDLAGFLSKNEGVDQFRFPWRMCASDRAVDLSLSDQARAVPSYAVTQYKSMTRSVLLGGIGDTHDPWLRRPLTTPPRLVDGAFLLHFAVKGRIDPYLKSRDQGLTFNHAGDDAKLKALMDPAADRILVRDLPKRVMAALGEVSCVNARESLAMTTALASVTDHALLGRLVSLPERSAFASRWEDLKRADLFKDFIIRDRPKFQIWLRLSAVADLSIPLRPLPQT